jgi:hypothetical protein
LVQTNIQLAARLIVSTEFLKTISKTLRSESLVITCKLSGC